MSIISVLALSSSRVGNGGYLESAAPVIKQFLGDAPLKIAFIPFASVSNDYAEYELTVKKGLHPLPYIIEAVTPSDAHRKIENADVIMVGGGNTFKLLHDIYAYDLFNLIRRKVMAGVPYIGWSAGANITGATIGTTNDMPVTEPKSFKGLSFFPFQINPHYTNKKPAGHNGETRDQRLEEFVLMNPSLKVIALPEGTALTMIGNKLQFSGSQAGFIFSKDPASNIVAKIEISANNDLSGLL